MEILAQAMLRTPGPLPPRPEYDRRVSKLSGRLKGGLARYAPRAREARLRKRYLDLLEAAVTHTLYHPPDRGDRPAEITGAFVAEIEAAGEMLEVGRAIRARNEGRDWPRYAPTMVGGKRLRNVRELVERVLGDGVDGDLIEAGCWRGGVGVMMKGILEAYGDEERRVWLADSFAGLPEPDPERYPADAGDINYTAESLAIPVDEVRGNFRRFRLLDERVRFVEGWFRDTLPRLAGEHWAIVRLDGDLYESTMDGLVNLYPQLVAGGFLIIDDYGFPNCRQAVEDYRREHEITEPITEVDWTGAYWRRRD
jgi:O-methyltransferase